MKSIIILLLIIFSLSAKGQNPWKSLAYNSKFNWEYDTTSTKRQGNVVYATIYDITSDKLELETLKAKYKQAFYEDFDNFSHTIKDIEFDCIANKYRMLLILYYDKNDKLIKAIEPSNSWFDIVPSSVAKRALDILCAKIK